MKLSLEERTDARLALYKVRAHITHLRHPVHWEYSVVTVATPEYVEYKHLAVSLGLMYLEGSIHRTKGSALDALLIARFAGLNAGTSPCHRQDNFSRKRGRIIAKGRLLKLLRAQAGVRT